MHIAEAARTSPCSFSLNLFFFPSAGAILAAVSDSIGYKPRHIAPCGGRALILFLFGIGNGYFLFISAHKDHLPRIYSPKKAFLCTKNALSERKRTCGQFSGDSLTVCVIFASPLLSYSSARVLASGSYFRIISLTFSSRVRL